MMTSGMVGRLGVIGYDEEEKKEEEEEDDDVADATTNCTMWRMEDPIWLASTTRKHSTMSDRVGCRCAGWSLCRWDQTGSKWSIAR